MILAVCANPSVDSFWSFDQINKGVPNRSQKERFYPGGKGVHVSFALKELGEEVKLLGVWGGETGQWLCKECESRNISALGPQVKDWTRICITNQSNNDWNGTELLGSGPVISKEQTHAFIAAFKKQLTNPGIKAVTLSGSVPKGMPTDLYKQLVLPAKEEDILTYVDASGELLEQTLEARPYAIHINEEEGRSLFGDLQPEEIARKLGNHCSMAAVTAGADGLYLLVDDQLYHAYYKLDPATIHSTVGAGDCLLAGLCKASVRNDDYSYWASYAAACGSANCITPELGMLQAKTVENIVSNVTVTERNL